jgi:hypothetical protein
MQNSPLWGVGGGGAAGRPPGSCPSVLHSVADPAGMFFLIPDPTFFHPGSEFFPSRIRIKEFKYFNPKKWFLSSRKYDPGCSSRIPDPDPDFLPIRDPGVKKAPDRQHWFYTRSPKDAASY